MSVTLLGHYLTNDGDLVRLEKLGEGSYDAVLVPSSFLARLRLGLDDASRNSAEAVLAWVKDWDPQAKELTDLGDYPLYVSPGSLGDPPVYNTRQVGSFQQPVAAREVQPGAALSFEAVGFFEYWRGRGSVDVDNRVLLGTPARA